VVYLCPLGLIVWSKDNKTAIYFILDALVSKFDTINRIVAGTFYFTAIDSSGKTVKVTNGRFDIKYPN
jgi:ABC-type uncharacterized transport system substrate-binding protein